MVASKDTNERKAQKAKRALVKSSISANQSFFPLRFLLQLQLVRDQFRGAAGLAAFITR